VIGTLTRRSLLLGSAAVLGTHGLKAAKPRITKARISATTDEIGRTQTEAVAAAKQSALQWVDLRNVPGSKKEFASLSEPELRRYASELAANKLKVSLLRTSLLKFSWPDLSPGDPDLESNRKRWDRRKDDLSRAVSAAQILGIDKIAIFTGTRVTNPEKAYPVIAKALDELAAVAETAKVRLLIENESTQNIGACAELKAVMDLVTSKTIGFNWDPYSADVLNETSPWPEGYARLPKARMGNVQIQAEGLSDGPQWINWRKVMEALERDGYSGQISVAAKASNGTFEKANDSIREVMHIVGEL
jgi:sugar phosphate isomerase/epimerase